MLDHLKNENILFLDIETVPVKPSFDEVEEPFKTLWDKKSAYFRKDDQTAADTWERAGIYAEFGKIICISVGMLYQNDGKMHLRIKSFFGDDERALLEEFSTMLTGYSRKKTLELCAHNGKEFDFPYISRRMLVNGLPLPAVFDTAGKKPWEVNFIDTLELWKFGDYKHYTSLNLLTALFGIPTPKDDIDGSMVAEVYYIEKNLRRIVTYCEKDVIAVAQLLLRYKGQELLLSENIETVTPE
ncbi:MAG TPA: 3'-5' exonuclease [Bacteroidales bacterium]|nr:3'-5' exonuclease [Bacteroidales bacterium]